MKRREELLSSHHYWSEKIKLDIYDLATKYIEKHNITKYDFGLIFGLCKSEADTLFNGDYNCRAEKLAEIALGCGVVPDIKFIDVERFIQEDRLNTKINELTRAESSNLNVYQKLERLDKYIDILREKYAGLGEMSLLIRGIKGDLQLWIKEQKEPPGEI